ncbi:MAG: hypothetical protein HUJ26_12670 [Planctomycetaceae bacterium]|nr:hypothetical protein [Planctomycetaceae bacterium]
MMAKKKKYLTGDIRKLLRTKFQLPQYALIEEVPNGTSTNKTRSCDALAMGCWKSSGIELNGFEIKVNRSDWTKELNDPGKAEAFARYCHRWWIVAAPGIVKLEELPAEWGLMEPARNGNGLSVRSQATKHRDPEPIPFRFLASLLRKAVEAGEDADRIKQAFREGRLHEQKLKMPGDHWRNKYLVLKKKLEVYEQSSGIDINDHWNAEQLGTAVKQVLDLRRNEAAIDGVLNTSRLDATIERYLETIREFQAEIEKLSAQQEAT